jgi:murein DD-endopeptidase MepM/ murein hydrolase activator NlpD
MQAHPVLDPEIPLSAYRKVDFSIDNALLRQRLPDAPGCQAYLRDLLEETKGQVGWGGYLEQRNLYRGFDNFNPQTQEPREYHLGVDFWATEGTSVHAPWDGVVHSWANRTTPGDYGPVILMQHRLEDTPVVSLFGHLSGSSLQGLYEGKTYRRGDLIGFLGSPGENGGYAPHLHFQLIYDLQGFQGDYPGVCSLPELPFYRQNCPNPMEMLAYF